MNTAASTGYWMHKLTTASILIVGACLNVTALFFGMDRVAATVFTTTGEAILTAWFFAAFVSGVLAEVAVPLENRRLRIIRRVVTVYMLMLTLAHGVNNLLLGNTDAYAKIFSGPFYMYPAIVVLAGLAILIAALPAPAKVLAGIEPHVAS
jgi:hypothetical protein